jgi:outer membrane biosynthesis protein TonB
LQVAEAPTDHVVYPVAPYDGVRGKVRLQVVIAANGLVKEVYALSGQRSLAEAAAAAVHSWHYSTFSGSHPTERATTVTVSFLGSDAVFMEFPSWSASGASSGNLVN